MATFSLQSKNYATFLKFLRHGSGRLIEDMLMNELADYTFDDIVFEDGTQLKNLTFLDVVAQQWTNATKNVASFTLAVRGSSNMTWDRATFTWDEAQGTWDDPRDVFGLATKNLATLVLATKN